MSNQLMFVNFINMNRMNFYFMNVTAIFVSYHCLGFFPQTEISAVASARGIQGFGSTNRAA